MELVIVWKHALKVSGLDNLNDIILMGIRSKANTMYQLVIIPVLNVISTVHTAKLSQLPQSFAFENWLNKNVTLASQGGRIT